MAPTLPATPTSITTIASALALSSAGAWVLFHGIAEMKLLGGKTKNELTSWKGEYRLAVEKKFLGAVMPSP